MFGGEEAEQPVAVRGCGCAEPKVGQPPSGDMERVFQDALAAHRRGDLATAERLYRQMLEADPHHARAWHFLGVIALAREHFEEARKSIEYSLKLAPSKAVYWNNYGAVLKALGWWSEAQTAFSRAIALRDDYADAWSNLGLIHLEQGELQEAESCLRHALGLQPRHIDALRHLVRLRFLQGNLAEAARLAEQALALAPQHAELLLQLGQLYATLKQFGKAVQVLRQAADLRPNWGEAHLNLGLVLNDLEEIEQARIDFGQAARLCPTRPLWKWRELSLCPAVDARGRLVRTIQPDPDGPNGPLTSPVTQQFYDTAGRLSQVIDPVGTITEYAYDNADRQTAVYHGILLDDADGGYAETGPNWSDWEEGYGDLSRVHPTVTGDPTAAATWTFSHLLLGMEYEVYATWEADPDNAQDAPFAIFAGDTSGQPLATLTVDQSQDPGQTGPSRSIAGRTFRKLGTFTVSNPTLIVRLANNSITAGKNVVADAVVVRLASPLSQTFYDNAGRVTGTLDPLGRLTAYEYDAAGRQTKIIQPDPDGQGPQPAPMTQYVYNTGGQLVQVIDPLGRVTAYEYDALGRRSKVILPDPDGSGSLTSPQTLYQYDKLGRLVAVTDPLGNVTTYEYDARGRQIRVTQPDPDGSGPLEAPVTEYQYDAAGQLTAVTDHLGRVTTYEYDNLGRQVKITQPDPDGEGDELAPWTLFSYDAAGRLVSQSDRLDHTTTFTYDNLGRLILQTDPNGAETTYTYDPAGRRLSLTDPVGNTTTWTYDALGRTVAETNELSDSRSFVYDAAGYLVRQIDRLGRVRLFQYDNLGRNTAEIWYNNVQDAEADQNRQRTISFSYDLVGQLTSVNDIEADYTYSYDALGRVTTIAHSFVGLTPMVTFTQVYDAAGRRTRLIAQINGTPDFKNRYFYDALGRITDITQTSQSGGNPVATKWLDFSYDAASQLVGLVRYADLGGTQLVAESSYSYDQAGRLRSLSHFQGQTTFVEHTWNFDAANRMTQYVNSVDGTADYTHDNAGQLIGADYDYQTDESYQYDDNGNRVTANGSMYTTGANNRLVSDGTYRYLYDAEGNRTYRFIDNNQNGQLDQGDTDITKYNWDHRNRLYKVQHQASYGAAVDWVIRYSYDYQNRLVWRRMDGNGDGDYEQKRVFVYDGNQMVMEFQRTGAGNIQASNLRWRYLWGPAVDQILAEEAVNGGADETVQWTLTDHLNTVRDIAKYNSQTDMTTVVNHLIYDAFGRLRSESNPAVDSLFLFTARPFDPDSQLQNNLNRWYDARVGRWLSEDPVGFAAGGMNLYRYVENQALTKTDPSGFDAGNANNPCPCGEALTQIWAVGPLNAFIADQLRQEAYAVTNDVAPRLPGGKGGIHNGAADAFRHCYWSCRMTEELGPEIAKRIADIHEFCARHVQPVAEEAMDQFNNKMGREFGQAVGRTGNCRERCEKAIREGRLQLSPGGPRPDNSYSDEYPQF